MDIFQSKIVISKCDTNSLLGNKICAYVIGQPTRCLSWFSPRNSSPAGDSCCNGAQRWWLHLAFRGAVGLGFIAFLVCYKLWKQMGLQLCRWNVMSLWLPPSQPGFVESSEVCSATHISSVIQIWRLSNIQNLKRITTDLWFYYPQFNH